MKIFSLSQFLCFDINYTYTHLANGMFENNDNVEMHSLVELL